MIQNFEDLALEPHGGGKVHSEIYRRMTCENGINQCNELMRTL